jgi:hypothetical protein
MCNRLFLAGTFVLALAAQPLIAQSATPQTTGPVQDAGPSAPENPNNTHQHGPPPKPTNLKVLPKNIAPEDLIKIMRGYAGALGVECNFCHAANPQTHKLDFASDTKEDKGIARTMIAMTRTINEQYMSQVNDPDAMPMDKHVTCGTCHRGHQMPEHFTPSPEGRHRPPAGTAPAPKPQ